LNEKPVENVVETQPKEEVAKRPKEAVQGSKLNDRVSVEKSFAAKSVSSVDLDAITSTKGKIPNVRVEIFRADDMCNKEQSHKEAQQSSTAASDVKTAVEHAKETAEPAGLYLILLLLRNFKCSFCCCYFTHNIYTHSIVSMAFSKSGGKSSVICGKLHKLSSEI